MATYSSSADITSTVKACWGTNGSSWGSTITYNVQDGDNCRFYLGHGRWVSSGSTATWRPVLWFTTPNVQLAGPSKLQVKLIADSKWTPARMRGFLSNAKSSSSDWVHIVGSSSKDPTLPILDTSYLYSDTAGTTQQTSALSATSEKTAACYLIFEYNFAPNTTYYIYLLPYDSNSDANNAVNMYNTWCRWRLMSGYIALTFYYNSGVVWINTDGTDSGWKQAIPYINTDGTDSGWKQAIPYVNSDGTDNGWKICC